MLVNIANTTGMSTSQMQQMGETIRRMATESGASLDQLGQGFFHITSLGYQGADAVKILDASMRSAVATGGNVSSVANTLAASMREFNINTADAGKAMDVLMRSAAQGNTTLGQLVEGGARSIAMAGTLSDSLTDVGAVLADLTRHGFPNVAAASTQVVGMFNSLIKPSKEAQAEIERLSRTTGVDLVHDFGEFAQQAIGQKGLVGVLKDVQAAVGTDNEEVLKLFGNMRGGVGVLALTGAGFSDLNQIIGQNQQAWNQGGQTADAYARKQDTVNQQLAVAKANIHDAAISVGDELLPMVTQITAGMAAGASATASFAREHATITATAVGVAGALGTAATAAIAYQRLLSPLVSGVREWVAGEGAASASEQAEAGSIVRLTEVTEIHTAALERHTAALRADAGAGEAEVGVTGAEAVAPVAPVPLAGARSGFAGLAAAAADLAIALGPIVVAGVVVSEWMQHSSEISKQHADDLRRDKEAVDAYAQSYQQLDQSLGAHGATLDQRISAARAQLALAITQRAEAEANIDKTLLASGGKDSPALTGLYDVAIHAKDRVEFLQKAIENLSHQEELDAAAASKQASAHQSVMDTMNSSALAASNYATSLEKFTALAEQSERSDAARVSFTEQVKQGNLDAALSQDEWTKRLGAYAEMQKDADPATQAYVRSQVEVSTALRDLGPVMADHIQRVADETEKAKEADKAHQELEKHIRALNDAWSDAAGAGGSTRQMLQEINKELADGSEKASDLQSHINDLLNRPTAGQLALRSQIADATAQLDKWNADIANSSPALQAVANFQKVYDQARLTGATLKEQEKAKTDLDAALAQTGPAGQAIAAEQQHIDALSRTRSGLQAKEQQLGSGHAAQIAATQATQGGALSEGEFAQAAQLMASDYQRSTGQVQTATTTMTGQVSTQLDNTAKAAPAQGTAVTTGYAGGIAAAQPQAVSAAGGVADASIAALASREEQAKAAGVLIGRGFAQGVLGGFTTGIKTDFGPVIPGVPGPGQGAGAGSGATEEALRAPIAEPARITQGYGPTDETAEPAYGGYAHFHEGIDFGVPTGTPVHSVGAGTVVAAGMGVVSPGQGNSVVIDLGNGLRSIDSHLSEISVKVGDLVTAGQVVGASGNTGTATTGPHLHFALTLNGEPVDPMPYLAGPQAGKIGRPGGVAGAATTSGASQPLAGMTPAQAAAAGLLPESWYAAIQGHESTLPLPTPGAPQPMFGIIPEAGAPYSVGTGYYSSGGTSAASASLGVPAGTTRQALFPTVAAGEAAFDQLIRQHASPQAMAALARGDFAGFINAIAPWYAGPGEAPGFSSQVIAAYNPSATLGGGGAAQAGPGGGYDPLFGQLPAPRPDTATAPLGPGAQAKDTATADRQLQSITDTYTKLTGAVAALGQVPEPKALAPDAAAFTASMSQIQGAYDRVQQATNAYNAAVASGVSGKPLTDLRDALTAAQNDWGTLADQANHALSQMRDDEHAYTSALAETATAQGRLGQLTGTRFAAHKAEAQTALQAELDANNRLVADIENHVNPAQLEADRLAAESAKSAANTAYQAWKQSMDLRLAAEREVNSAEDNLRQTGQAIIDEALLNTEGTHRAANAAILASDVQTSQERQTAALGALATLRADEQRTADDARALREAADAGASEADQARLQGVLETDKQIEAADQRTATNLVNSSKQAAATVKADRASIKEETAAEKAFDIKPVGMPQLSGKPEDAALNRQIQANVVGENQALASLAANARAAYSSASADAARWQQAADGVQQQIAQTSDAATIAMLTSLLDSYDQQIAADDEKKQHILANLQDQVEATKAAAQQSIDIARQKAQEEKAAEQATHVAGAGKSQGGVMLIDTATGIMRPSPDISSGYFMGYGQSFGAGFSEGVAQGVSAGQGSVNSAVSSLAGNAVQAGRRTLHIASPSAVTRDEIGRPMAEGIAAGIHDGQASIDAALWGAVHRAIGRAGEITGTGGWLTELPVPSATGAAFPGRGGVGDHMTPGRGAVGEVLPAGDATGAGRLSFQPVPGPVNAGWVLPPSGFDVRGPVEIQHAVAAGAQAGVQAALQQAATDASRSGPRPGMMGVTHPGLPLDLTGSGGWLSELPLPGAPPPQLVPSRGAVGSEAPAGRGSVGELPGGGRGAVGEGPTAATLQQAVTAGVENGIAASTPAFATALAGESRGQVGGSIDLPFNRGGVGGGVGGIGIPTTIVVESHNTTTLDGEVVGRSVSRSVLEPLELSRRSA